MILHKIAESTELRVKKDKESLSLEEIKHAALKLQKGELVFEKALNRNRVSIIAEVKKASPSKGIISADFPFLKIAKEYEQIRVAAISVLTEPNWFLGSKEIFMEIRNHVKLPMLRKDFTIDKYQIYQSYLMGADAILLIVALLNEGKIKEYLDICKTLGISAVVETHDKKEIEIAINAGAKIIGVNNRNLNDFTVDLNNASNLKKYIPKDVVYVAESGILSPSDGINLINNGANALLIGEALMKSDDKEGFIKNILEHKYE